MNKFSDRELRRLAGFVDILEDGPMVVLARGLKKDGIDVAASFDLGFTELLADAVRELVDRSREEE